MRTISCLTLLLLAACQIAPRTDRFIGQVEGCGRSSQALLDRRANEVVLTPDQGVLTLHGQIDAAGQIHASAIQGSAAGNGTAPHNSEFTGHLQDDAINGTLTQAGCTSRVTLERFAPGLGERVKPPLLVHP
jgi:hypothetical protein